MQITFLGATRTVTGSKYLISTQNKKILIDCGLYQGYKELRLRNWSKLPVDPQDIDAVILTHAHIDHTGYIPLLVKNGFTGRIYCTNATRDLCAILLPDCGHLEEEDANRANRYGYTKHKPALPLYTYADAVHSLEQFTVIQFDKPLNLFNEFSITFLPSGHIMGSALVKLEHQGKSILFTGDLGRQHHPIMKPPVIAHDCHYLVVESTYGDRLHNGMKPEDQLADVINNTVLKGGSIIIPAFAVGRTQDVLYYLYLLKQQQRIPNIPIYLDSPMAQDVSDLLAKYSNQHQLSKELCKQVCNTAKYIRTPEESKTLDQSKSPMIIISASGMATGGRVLHHLKTFLPDEKSTILFTGFQAPGTRGEQLTNNKSEIKIYGEEVPVKANIVIMQNMSAHADYQEMITWLKHFTSRPKKVFITHGTLESALALKETITQKLGWKCNVPEYLQTTEL